MDKAKGLSIVNAVAPVLVIIGALNWGLIGLFDYNVVDAVFGGSSVGNTTIEKIIYILIGVSALWNIGLIPKLIKK